MNECGWCGKVMVDEPVLIINNPAMVMGASNTEVELMPACEIAFCCHGCAWAFSVETHRLMGLSGKDLRNHLRNVHGFSHSPGKPAGGMRNDCVVIKMAQRLASVFDEP